jgi:hypothetical protein
MTHEIPKLDIHYFKSKLLDLKHLEKTFDNEVEDIEHEYNPFRIDKFQLYNPIYSSFFELAENNYNTIALNHRYHMVSTNSVFDKETKTIVEKEVFIKYSPLVDPIRYMVGKYKNYSVAMRNLPSISNTDTTTSFSKLTDKNNASYVDNFFCYLSGQTLSNYNFPHGVGYYGSFLGIQDKFKMNITDDFEYLNSSNYFLDNINKLFSLTSSIENEFMNFGSRGNKEKLNISTTNVHNLSSISVVDLDVIDSPETDNVKDDELVYEKKIVENKNASLDSNSETDESSDGTDNDSNEEEQSECEEDEVEDDDGYSDESNVFSYINNFPVQMICLEKCHGTLDELFEKEKINKNEVSSALFQIVMILITYQKLFSFTHNDLHTNNIMFVNTDTEYLYYKYNNNMYKVPTYGKVYKIIDFGRSIYKFKGLIFFSDSFANGGDAATQYNSEPYINEAKPRIDPNYSFDLCRLGCSIYDFIIDNDKHPEKFDELQKTIYRWCLDDSNKNVLYKKNGEERYHDFRLYKMIARTVHNHRPECQLEFPYFKRFLIKNKDNIKDLSVFNIDNLQSQT